jgi:hypothetical protein
VKLAVLIDSDLDDLRATLEHTWLKRRLLSYLRTERDTWLKAAGAEPLPKVLDGIPARIKEARQLQAKLIECYSPAQLVERGPLAVLPDGAKKLIKDAVHKAYLDSGIIQSPAKQFGEALDNFESKTAEIARAWARGKGAKRIECALDDLESAAQRLRSALLDLPQEVVLP